MSIDIYNNKRVLITGHTGFKGSWLCLWLKHLGAKISGVALKPDTKPNHWELLNLDVDSSIQDIRDKFALSDLVNSYNPEIIFHLAAQPLVRRSYTEPLNTWETNVLGTVNLLDICRNLSDLKAVIVITTDKCYRNLETSKPYSESDPLGGNDPYSASKAATEMVVESYRKSFFNNKNDALIASARAGNVIGGGDWSVDRLIPDIIRSFDNNSPLQIRNPNATRPWQHVLEPLYGYLLLGEKLIHGEKKFARPWNFGPKAELNISVNSILEYFKKQFPELNWEIQSKDQPYESQLLSLDSSMAREKLSWSSVLDIEKTIKMTADWYKVHKEEKQILSKKQISEYSSLLSL